MNFADCIRNCRVVSNGTGITCFFIYFSIRVFTGNVLGEFEVDCSRAFFYSEPEGLTYNGGYCMFVHDLF